MDARKIAVSVLAVLVGLSVVIASPVGALTITSDCKVTIGTPITDPTDTPDPVVIHNGDSVFSIEGDIHDSDGLPSGYFRLTETPASGCPDYCDGLPGAQYGLCNAYCEAMDCDSDVPMANPIACGKVLENFKKKSGGFPPPCEHCENSFISENVDYLFCFINGGNVGVISGTGYWNGAGPYRFDLTVEADTVRTIDLNIHVADDPYPPIFEFISVVLEESGYLEVRLP